MIKAIAIKVLRSKIPPKARDQNRPYEKDGIWVIDGWKDKAP